MRAIYKRVVAFTVWLCGMFSVTPGSLIKDKRGNLPPPSDGVGSYAADYLEKVARDWTIYQALKARRRG